VLVARERRFETFSSAWRHVDARNGLRLMSFDRSRDELLICGIRFPEK
jgi:hypothetical protein